MKLIACGLILVVAAQSSGEPISYRLIDMGSLGGFNGTAFGVSNTRQVVGYSQVVIGSQHHAYVYQNGTMFDIGTLGGSDSTAYAISEAGTIVGVSGLAGDFAFRAFMYANGQMTQIGPSLSNLVYAFAVNEANKVVGASFEDGTYRAYVWDQGVTTYLGSFGGTNTTANDINESDVIVGRSYTSNNASYRAYRSVNGTMMDIGTLGGASSEATALNDSGQIVGHSAVGNSERAFLYENGQMRNLGTIGTNRSFATDINSAGQIVGQLRPQSGSGDPSTFLYSRGVMSTLNSLLDSSGATYFMVYAESIADDGAICGIARPNWGREQPVLLVPNVVWPTQLNVVRGDWFAGDVSSLKVSDDNKIRVLPDADLRAEVEFIGYSNFTSLTRLSLHVEASAARPGLAQLVQVYNFSLGQYVWWDGRAAPTEDAIVEAGLGANDAQYVGPGGMMKARCKWEPINDEDPAHDGWLHSVDEVYWNV